MADLLAGLIALVLTFFMGGSAPEAYMVAFLATCYVRLCDISRKVEK